MDLWGKKVARLRLELEELARKENDANARADQLEGKAARTAARARERQDKVAELETVIDDLRGEIVRLSRSGAPSTEVSAAQQALDVAMTVHGRGSR